MTHREIQGHPGRGVRLLRRTEEQVDIAGNARPLQGLQRERGGLKIEPLVEFIQHPLIPGLDPQLEHGTARALQAAAEVLIGQLLRDAGKAVPGHPQGVLAKPLKQRRAQGVVQKMHQTCRMLPAETGDFRPHARRTQGHVSVPLGRFRTERAASPVAALRGAVGQNESRGQVVGQRKVAVMWGSVRPAGLFTHQGGQPLLAWARHHLVHQSPPGASPVGLAHPCTHQSPAQNDPDLRQEPAEITDHGEGA